MLRDAVSIRRITLHSGRNVIITETYHIHYGLSGCDQEQEKKNRLVEKLQQQQIHTVFFI